MNNLIKALNRLKAIEETVLVVSGLNEAQHNYYWYSTAFTIILDEINDVLTMEDMMAIHQEWENKRLTS